MLSSVRRGASYVHMYTRGQKKLSKYASHLSSVEYWSSFYSSVSEAKNI